MARKPNHRRLHSTTSVEHVSPTPPPEPARPTSRRSSLLPLAQERPPRAITPLISSSSPSSTHQEPLRGDWVGVPRDLEAGFWEEDADHKVLERTSIPLLRLGIKKVQRMAKKRGIPALRAVSESDDGSSSGGEVSGGTGGNGGGDTGDYVARVIKSRIRLVVAIWLILGALVAWVILMRSRFQV